MQKSTFEQQKKVYYLHLMGVTTWRLRAAKKKPDYHRFQLFRAGKEFGFLSAIMSPENSQQFTQEKELLAAIVKALNLETQPIATIPENPPNLIIFDQNSFPLSEMLSSPALKKQFWQKYSNP
jgi:hypothetical protein